MEKRQPIKWGKLTPEKVYAHFKEIKLNFPELREGFYNQLLISLIEHEFTDEDLFQACTHVISTCTWVPTIAHFIQFKGKKAKSNSWYGLTADDISIMYDRIHDN